MTKKNKVPSGTTEPYSLLMLLSSLKGLEYPYDTIFPSVKTLGYCQRKKR
jgi:hypothetical protein